ncbi:MAG: hypothetical protein NTV54_00515 [Ignavibacteriales bacterium]|nr:hypothetical protein [Ignavibacteriales bacterium]
MPIDKKKIIADLSKIEVKGDKNGLIEGFNVLVNQLPAKFWNSFADRLTTKAPPDILEAIEGLLINSAHECGYHTGYGIITSDEWNAVVKPMIEKAPEDILAGAFAVLGAFGWANTEIIELVPGKALTVRAYDYYESNVVSFGSSPKKSAYMLRGICAAFMDLAYGGNYDPTGKTGVHTFTCKQTKGIECGDDYGEFIATKA